MVLVNLWAFLNHASTKAVHRATASTVSFTDLANMLQAHKGDMKEWVISQTLLSTLITMTDANSGLIFTNGVGGMAPTLLGYPVRWRKERLQSGLKAM